MWFLFFCFLISKLGGDHYVQVLVKGEVRDGDVGMQRVVVGVIAGGWEALRPQEEHQSCSAPRRMWGSMSHHLLVPLAAEQGWKATVTLHSLQTTRPESSQSW